MEHKYQNIKISGRSLNDSTAMGDSGPAGGDLTGLDEESDIVDGCLSSIVNTGITGPIRDGVEEEPNERLVVLSAGDEVIEELAEVFA